MPCRTYSATGTFVRWCSALSCVSCSGVMYTVVEIFLRDMRLATYDPTWPYEGGQRCERPPLPDVGTPATFGDRSHATPAHGAVFPRFARVGTPDRTGVREGLRG